jgi:hypothetical protein
MNPHNRLADHPESSPDGAPFKTDIVNNIPMHHAAPEAAKDDDDLDKIMQDVGHQLNTENHKPAKRRHLFGGSHPKSEAKLVAQPVPRGQFSEPVHSAPHQMHQPAASPAHPTPKVKPVPKAKSSAPVMVIVLTLVVTGILIAAAVSAYK